MLVFKNGGLADLLHLAGKVLVRIADVGRLNGQRLRCFDGGAVVVDALCCAACAPAGVQRAAQSHVATAVNQGIFSVDQGLHAHVYTLTPGDGGRACDASHGFLLVAQGVGRNGHTVAIDATCPEVVHGRALYAGVRPVDQAPIGQGVGDLQCGGLAAEQLPVGLIVEVTRRDAEVFAGLDGDRIGQRACGLQLQIAPGLQGARQGMVALQAQADVCLRDDLSSPAQAACTHLNALVSDHQAGIVAQPSTVLDVQLLHGPDSALGVVCVAGTQGHILSFQASGRGCAVAGCGQGAGVDDGARLQGQGLACAHQGPGVVDGATGNICSHALHGQHLAAGVVQAYGLQRHLTTAVDLAADASKRRIVHRIVTGQGQITLGMDETGPVVDAAALNAQLTAGNQALDWHIGVGTAGALVVQGLAVGVNLQV